MEKKVPRQEEKANFSKKSINLLTIMRRLYIQRNILIATTQKMKGWKIIR
jgi:hypothetical protein